MAVPESIIVSDPEVMSGVPCFRGTRVPLKNLMDYIEGGYPLAEFLEDFPTVSRAMAVQALEDAKDSLLARIRALITISAGEIVALEYSATHES